MLAGVVVVRKVYLGRAASWEVVDEEVHLPIVVVVGGAAAVGEDRRIPVAVLLKLDDHLKSSLKRVFLPLPLLPDLLDLVASAPDP